MFLMDMKCRLRCGAADMMMQILQNWPMIVASPELNQSQQSPSSKNKLLLLEYATGSLLHSRMSIFCQNFYNPETFLFKILKTQFGFILPGMRRLWFLKNQKQKKKKPSTFFLYSIVPAVSLQKKKAYIFRKTAMKLGV